jgi:O-antigen ligase
MLALIINPEKVILPCRLDKCGILNSRISESLQGNVLGLVFAVCLAILMNSQRKSLWFTEWLVLTFISLTVGGRASISSLIIVLLLQISTLFLSHSQAIQNIGLRVLATTSLIIASIFPFTIGKLPIFNDRKVLWDSAFSMVKGNWFFGYGPDYWVTSTSYAGNFTYSPHNLILSILVSGGLFALMLTIGVLAIPIFSKPFEVQEIILRIVVLLGFNGAIESGFNSVGVGTIQFVFIFLLFGLVQRNSKS